MNTAVAKANRPRALGAALFIPGAFAVVMSLMSRRGHRTNLHDPGPWFLPLLLGFLLCLGAVVLIVRCSRSTPAPVRAKEPLPGRLTWEFLIGVAAFLWALPWIGFLAATPVFVTLMLVRLKVIWWKALAAAVILTLAAQGLFAGLFKVPLPSGIWN